MKIAIRQSQKINSRIHNSRIAIRQRIAQLGVKMVISWSNFVVRSKVYHFDHGKFVSRPRLWSKWVFLWLNFEETFLVDHFDHGKFGLWPWSWSKF